MTDTEIVWTTLTFAVGVNSDNVLVGLAYGLKGRSIGAAGNLVIAGITTLSTLAALTIGRTLAAMLPVSPGAGVGGEMLILFAAWNILRNRNKGGVLDAGAPRPGESGADRAPLGEVLFLAGTLSINNIAAGFLGGIGELPRASSGIAVFVLSVFLLSLGLAIGGRWGSYGRLSSPLRHSAFGDWVLAFAGVIMASRSLS